MIGHAHATPLLQDFLAESARRFPDRVGLVCGGERVTYAELAARAGALASSLWRRGVRRGDRVVVFGDRTVETAVSFWAALEANAIVSIVNPQTPGEKLRYILGDCRPAALIAEGRLLRAFAGPASDSPGLKTVIVSGPAARDRLEALPGASSWEEALAEGAAEPRPARRAIDLDLASIIYTSGSTGEPKGVMQTHRSMRAAARSIAAYLEKRPDDVILGALPLSFDYGLYQMIMAFLTGARLVLERSSAYPARLLETAERERVTGFPGVPTMFALLAELSNHGDYDLSSVRYLTNTAAALPKKHIDFLARAFPGARIYSMYGLTECKRVSYLPPEDLERKPESVGIAIPNTEVWIAGGDGRPLPPGEVGEIVVRGATVMRGYWEKPEETAEKLRPGPLPGEQVLHTGDYGRMDEEGYLYFVGRMDDIIKSRGEKVPPRAVEDVIVSIPGVRETAVVGAPDPILGAAIKAYVVLEEGARLDARAVKRACEKRLESFMVPRHVVFTDELPKTATGKIRKSGL